MRFLHIADLHFGKVMNELPLVEEDQPFWVERFLEVVKDTKADAVVIAGDVYDRSSPSAEAVELFDRMLTRLSELEVPVLIVAGNHDSGVRLSFASDILKKGNIHIAGVIGSEDGVLSHVAFKDEFGEVVFWMMPYIFPAMVNEKLGTDHKDYDSACRALIEHQNIDRSVRNVMIAHQNVTRNGDEAERGGSESMVAGVGGIEYTAFEDFEYTALGHIHKAQPVSVDRIRYAGSPLCYHFDEARFPKKGPVLVELGEKGTDAVITVIPIEPLHSVREVKDSYAAIRDLLLNRAFEGEYLKTVVTDCRISPEISKEFRELALMSNNRLLEIMSSLSYKSGTAVTSAASGAKSLGENFYDFYRLQRSDAEPDDDLMALVSFISENSDVEDMDSVADRLIELAISQEVRA